MIRNITSGLALLLLLASPWTVANDDLDRLLNQVKEGQTEGSRINEEREARFLRERRAQSKLLKEAEAQLAKLNKDADKLRSQFTANEKTITELKAELKEEVGDLQQMVALIRQASSDLVGDVEESMISGQYRNRQPFLRDLARQDEIPAIDDIRQLWFLSQQEMTEAGKVVSFPATVTAADGASVETTVTRTGIFTAHAEGEFLRYRPDSEQFQILGRQPGQTRVATAEAQAKARKGVVSSLVDPTRGNILALMVETPNLQERIAQGGVVGYVIIGVGIFGVLIALLQGLYLLYAGLRMGLQKRKVGQPKKGNALGRVLLAVKDTDENDLETLELTLDEAILRESPRLERGLPLLKLCAAVAPLLGLLGTVTGMILTFQTITLFGTGDPKLMANGISQALVTTVLGLCVAIPLLFLHGWLASRSRKLLHLLDEQSAGLLAREIEQSRKSGDTA